MHSRPSRDAPVEYTRERATLMADISAAIKAIGGWH